MKPSEVATIKTKDRATAETCFPEGQAALTSREFSASQALQHKARTALGRITRWLDFEAAALLLDNPNLGMLQVVAVEGRPQDLAGLAVDRDSLVVRHCLAERKACVYAWSPVEPPFVGNVDAALKMPYGVAVPIEIGHEAPPGLLLAGSKQEQHIGRPRLDGLRLAVAELREAFLADRASAEARNLNHLLSTLYEAIPIPLLTVDSSGVVLLATDAFRKGAPQTPAGQQTLLGQILAGGEEAAASLLAALRAGQTLLEVELLDENGRRARRALRAVPVLARDGRVCGFHLLMDSGDSSRAAQELQAEIRSVSP